MKISGVVAGTVEINDILVAASQYNIVWAAVLLLIVCLGWRCKPKPKRLIITLPSGSVVGISPPRKDGRTKAD